MRRFLRQAGADWRNAILLGACGLFLLVQKFPICVYATCSEYTLVETRVIHVSWSWSCVCAMVRDNKCHSTYWFCACFSVDPGP